MPKEEISRTLLNRISIYAIERKKQQIDLQKRHGDMQTFCASLSREFNGHVRRIRNFSKIMMASLASKTELDPDELKGFRIIEDNTTNLMDLVDGLGHFLTADHANLQIQPVDLSALIQNLSKLIPENAEKEVQLSMKGDFPTIKGNESQLTMLFQNLITNAVKYSEGRVELVLEGRVDRTTQQCEIAVQNNGIGIDSKYFLQIFTPFSLHSADDYTGVGLGLSIVARIVERHNGTIRLESEPGQGSKFNVSLPLID